MKRTGIIAALCCAFALCLALVGCGGAASDGADEAKAAFAGTWDLVGMTQDGQETGQEDLEMLTSLGLEVYLNLNDDGTAVLALFGSNMEGTWEATSTTAGTVTLDGESISMTIDGDKLMMEQDGSSLTFQKGEPREAPASDEAAASADAASDEAAEAEGEASSKAAA